MGHLRPGSRRAQQINCWQNQSRSEKHIDASNLDEIEVFSIENISGAQWRPGAHLDTQKVGRVRPGEPRMLSRARISKRLDIVARRDGLAPPFGSRYQHVLASSWS